MIKFILGLVGMCALAYVFFFVPFGEMTLYSHFVGISRTKEAQALGDGVKTKVKRTTKNISRKLKDTVPDLVDSMADEEATPDAATEHSADDRSALKQLIDDKDEPSPEDRQALLKLIQDKSR